MNFILVTVSSPICVCAWMHTCVCARVWTYVCICVCQGTPLELTEQPLVLVLTCHLDLRQGFLFVFFCSVSQAGCLISFGESPLFFFRLCSPYSNAVHPTFTVKFGGLNTPHLQQQLLLPAESSPQPQMLCSPGHCWASSEPQDRVTIQEHTAGLIGLSQGRQVKFPHLI